MPTLYTTIGPWTFPTFTLFLTLAVLVSAGIVLRRAARPDWVADVYLGALVGAVLGARLFHVLLNWDYFRANLNEAFVVSLGGLDWHGAILGGLVGLYLAMRVRQWITARRGGFQTLPYTYPDLLDFLTPALPLLSLAAWWGCLAASCAYGLEVDNLSNYPALMVAETADVYGIVAPRYNTQVFGLIVSIVVLLVVGILFWRGRLQTPPPNPLPVHGEGEQRWRFWLTLALLSVGMFVIGFYRGDYVLRVAGLRGDQVLDVALVIVSMIAVSRQRSLK